MMEKINIGYYHKNQTNMILDGCEMTTKVNVLDKTVQTEGDSKSGEPPKITVNGQIAGTSTETDTVCTPHVCRQARQNYTPPDLANDSPWNRKKTYFFVGTFCVFIAWVVIYSTVSSFGLV
ncbi:unnamed protein product [Psylliodes chrysocephalus]|uniref:Uncharacterized protein n=1 Tax=Psylliodes chrysocephalus TaxID=3402493 RepID=A0A9P0D3B9_9CUCU|nr:unnamed protein product [Psylliodes chrysocephala]